MTLVPTASLPIAYSFKGRDAGDGVTKLGPYTSQVSSTLVYTARENRTSDLIKHRLAVTTTGHTVRMSYDETGDW